MVEFVHEYATPIRTASGETYRARVYADQQPGGLWEAWFVFFPAQGGRPLATDRESTQSKREDIVYWATGISPAYLEGALTRALQQLPEVQLMRHIARAEAQAAYSRGEAQVYEAAASQAIADVRAAETRRRLAQDELTRPARSSRRRRRRPNEA
jgi:hypothetical protein